VRANLEFVARLHDVRDAHATGRDMIKRLGSERHLAGEFAGGWKQRLAR
jgi:ABC-type multidrug transport system ATPase subunit